MPGGEVESPRCHHRRILSRVPGYKGGAVYRKSGLGHNIRALSGSEKLTGVTFGTKLGLPVMSLGGARETGSLSWLGLVPRMLETEYRLNLGPGNIPELGGFKGGNK